MNKNWILIAYFTIISNIVWSGGMGEYKSPEVFCANTTSKQLQNVLTFSIGPAWNKNGKTQNISFQPNTVNTYAANFHSNILPYGGLFLAKQKRLNHSLYAQFGIEVAGGGEAKLNGDIWENTNPNLNNFTYKYNISELRVMAKTKFLVDINYYGTMPFVTAAVGVGFNKSSGFTITPKAAGDIPPAAFSASTKTALTYALGVGLQENLNENWRASISYEFADWGTSQLGRATGQKSTKGLIVNNVYINSVFISLSHIT